MPKRTIQVVLLIVGHVLGSSCFSQAETFDIITYTPPKDWKKEVRQGVINYSDLNTKTGTFCVIAMYASTTSSGDPQKDFTKDWKDLVATPFGVNPNPKTDIQPTPDGWQLVTGAAPVKMNGIDCYIILNVISGFGKTVSVRSSFNDQSYTARLDQLFATMELDKGKIIPVTNTSKDPATQPKHGAGKFGSLLYTIPPGWKEQVFEDGVVFKPLDLPGGDLLSVQIMQPINFSGSLEAALAKSFAEARAMYGGRSMYQSDGVYSKNPPQRSFMGWNYIRGKGGIQMTNGDERGLELFVVKINNRIERIAILESRRYCGGVSRYYASDRVSYRNGIEALLYSMQFSDFNGTELINGVAGGEGIPGVWQGTIQSTGAATGVRLEVFSPIFFTNGQVYFGPKFPTEGLDAFNSRIPPELYPRNWGTYTFNNGSGVLQMPFGAIPFRSQGDKLIVTKNKTDWPFVKINSVDGARFNGTYAMVRSYDMIPTITFTAGGHFSDKGVVRVLCHDNNNCTNLGFLQGSGTYEVKNYSVIFNYTDGRSIKIAFPGAEYKSGQLSPSTIRMSFNEDPMTLQ